MIAAKDSVASVLKGREQLIDVFVGVSSHFAMLRDPLARKTMARLVTVEQAARIAGVDAKLLLERLNAAVGEGGAPASAPEPAPVNAPAVAAAETSAAPPPPGLFDTPAANLVDVDVREDLRAGREPFRQIMDAAGALKPGQVMRLRAIFDPVPLYSVLGKRGLAHHTERLAADDWRIWFYPSKSQASAPAAAASDVPAEDDVVILDVRGLEPPEPMERTLEALSTLPMGKTLVQLNVRVPQFLLPKLAERGFTWVVKEQSKELVRIFISHKPR